VLQAVYLIYCLKRSVTFVRFRAATKPCLEYCMRVPVALLLAAGLVGCSPAKKPDPAPVAFVPPAPVPPTQKAPMCARPVEKSAFDVAGLKSQLMVTALSCDSQAKYNAFINRYRADLVGDEKSVNGFFGRAYGRRAQQEHDEYITQLANAQSDLRIKSGTEFCHFNAPLLDQVLALKSGSDLPAFAASKPIQQSLALQECATTEAPPAKVTAKASTKKSKTEKN
jgi:hypothetical protein